MSWTALTTYWPVWLLLAWCVAVVRIRRVGLLFSVVCHRRWRLQQTFVWGRCRGCGRLSMARDFLRAMGCPCGSTKITSSRPATVLEALRMTLRAVFP